jgi:CDP-diacylglycerol--inositol 3-phosphatidyltransferase
MPVHPRRCSAIYAVSCLLDALDGYAARKLDQGTRFGAVLDMVTDRCKTTCLLVFLATAMPRWAISFQLLISLDLASHYVHMYATLSMGGSEQSHKNVDAERSWLLHLYYSKKVGGDDVTVVPALTYPDCALHALFYERVVLPRFVSSCIHWSG